MLGPKWLYLFCGLALVSGGPLSNHLQPRKDLDERGEPLQNIVTWDQYSLKINGERIMMFSGEFHPFRLPVPGLWLDIFQKIRAIGFNTVSFYVDWALVEGKQGDFSAEGVFDFIPFFDAAKKAGIYLLARPGPYINAESSGGGFPGWLQRIKGHVREANPEYLEAVHGYEQKIGAIMAEGQITKGGPIILLQPENEYSSPEVNLSKAYMADVEKWFRDAGVVVPFLSNDGFDYGNFAPGTGLGAVDIYGHDSYPVGFDCAQPYTWFGLSYQYFPGIDVPAAQDGPFGPVNSNPNFYAVHEIESPNTPYTITEFQGGSFDSWAGPGFSKCAIMTNEEFERVFYKNDYSFGVHNINFYMLYGGTNWGNLGFPYGYTSYDYGASIREDRTVMREKYSEMKLQANFFRVSPQYLTAIPHNQTNGTYTDTKNITVTPLIGNPTNFYVVRHANYSAQSNIDYKLKLPTSVGLMAIPRLGGSVSLNGRDSKILVTDYMAGSLHVLYSTMEIFTWQTYATKTIVILYAGPNELNEVAFMASDESHVLEGSLLKSSFGNGCATIQWFSSSERTVVSMGSFEVYLLDRNSAYNYWVLDLNGAQTSDPQEDSVIVNAGYLVRNVTIEGSILSLNGDTNRTTSIEVVGAPSQVSSISWNGASLECSWSIPSGRGRGSGWIPGNRLTATVNYTKPSFALPNMTSLDWKYADSLPEIMPTYDDSMWTLANHKYTNNTTVRPKLTTPTSLYASDYGYNTGTLLYRTSFTANGNESEFMVETQGGSAFCFSVWLNETFLGSWYGVPNDLSAAQNFSIPSLKALETYTITVVQAQNGMEENGAIGQDIMKSPRGILRYDLSGHDAASLEWRLTGNLGGEDYYDRTRGPLNEGGMYAERQGWYQPYPPISSSAFSSSTPFRGINKAGIAFYTASFNMDMPNGWDIPLSIVFGNNTYPAPSQVQLFVNGYQFGKYMSHLGPQTAFPVPEGILNYHGENWVAMTLWALSDIGAKLEDLSLKATAVIESGYGPVELSPMPAWTPRPNAY